MACWNGLSAAQQRRLIEVGNLPLGYSADGWCPFPAAIEVPERAGDEAPGPRFYCSHCVPTDMA